jgi:hypothetical protein
MLDLLDSLKTKLHHMLKHCAIRLKISFTYFCNTSLVPKLHVFL